MLPGVPRKENELSGESYKGRKNYNTGQNFSS